MYCRGTDRAAQPYAGVRRVGLPAVPGKSFNTLSHGLLAGVRARLGRHDVLLVVNVANAYFCALSRYTGQPVILNTDGQEWLRGKWGPLARRFFLTSARFAPKGATGLVSDCQAMAAVYERYFGAISTVIPYCVPAGQVARTACLRKYGVEQDDYFIVAGRLNPENNIDAIATAYSRTSLRQPLLVLGAANYESPVASRLRQVSDSDPRIRIVGHVDNRGEFLALIGAATGYLHGHSVGGMNPSLVEAMHGSALIVALDTEFNRETVGEAAYFFGRSDTGELQLAPALRAVMNTSVGERLSIRRSAAVRAREWYNVDDVVDAYEALLLAATLAPRQHSLSLPTRWRA